VLAHTSSSPPHWQSSVQARLCLLHEHRLVHFIGADGLVAPQAHLTSSRTQSGAADSLENTGNNLTYHPYDVHLGLIRKRVMDFILALIKLFSLGVTVEALRAKIDRKSAISLHRSHFDPEF